MLYIGLYDLVSTWISPFLIGHMDQQAANSERQSAKDETSEIYIWFVLPENLETDHILKMYPDIGVD